MVRGAAAAPAAGRATALIQANCAGCSGTRALPTSLATAAEHGRIQLRHLPNGSSAAQLGSTGRWRVRRICIIGRSGSPRSRSESRPVSAGIRAADRPAAITVCVACRVGREIDRGIGAVLPCGPDRSADARSEGHVLGPGVLATGKRLAAPEAGTGSLVPAAMTAAVTAAKAGFR